MLMPEDAYATKAGKDRVLGEISSYSHSLRECTPICSPRGRGGGLCSLHELPSRLVAFKRPGLPEVAGRRRRRFTRLAPGNMDYAHVSVASVEARRPDYVRTSGLLYH